MAQQNNKKLFYGGGALVIILAFVALFVAKGGAQDQGKRDTAVADPVQEDGDLAQSEPEVASRTTPRGGKRADSRLGSSRSEGAEEVSADSADNAPTKKKKDKKRRRRSQKKQSGEEEDEGSKTGTAKKQEPKRPF